MGLNRNADEVEGMRLGENEDRSEAVTDAHEVVGQTSETTEPRRDESPSFGEEDFDGGAPQSAADVTEAGREAERRTLDDETDRLGGEDSRPDF